MSTIEVVGSELSLNAIICTLKLIGKLVSVAFKIDTKDKAVILSFFGPIVQVCIVYHLCIHQPRHSRVHAQVQLEEPQVVASSEVDIEPMRKNTDTLAV